MKLSMKTFLVVSIAIFLFLLFLLFVIKPYLLEDPMTLDETNMRQDLERIKNDFDSDMGELSRLNKDWAVWDDTYSFLKGEDSNYINSNLTNQTFENNRINFILYFNHTNKLLYQEGFNLELHQPIPLSNEFSTVFQSLLSSSEPINRTFIIETEHGASISAVHSVFTSNGDGPRAGTLIMGRLLNRHYINQMGKELSLPLKWKRADYQRNAEDSVHVRNKETLIGKINLHEYLRQATYTIAIDKRRDFYLQRLDNIAYLSLYLLFASLMLMMIIHLLLQRFIVSRIYGLSHQLKSIQNQKNIKTRISVNQRYSDEISSLEKSVNQMLSSLEEKQHEVERMAYYDQLTHLPNRYLLEKQYVIMVEQKELQVALLFFDLDGFKQINDNYGHKTGDNLLQVLSSRLQGIMFSEKGFIARFGGDEFVVLFSYQQKLEVEFLATQISNAISEVCAVGPHRVKVSASIGVSCSQKNEKGLERLLQEADRAMYIAKSRGKSQVVFYDQINT